MWREWDMQWKKSVLCWSMVMVGLPLFAATVGYTQTPALYDAASVTSSTYQPKQELKDCDVCPVLVVVPPGSFMMGSPEKEKGRRDDESPQHRVNINYSLAVGKYAVTFAEWDACVDAGGCSKRPSDEGWGRGNRPVINVSWNDAQEYVGWLKQKTGKAYRLLSESEWEYVARAGASTAYSWGNTASHEYANYGSDNCCSGLASGRDQWVNTAPVGSFPPNAFGLYDLEGNVWEWVQDCYQDSYRDAPTDGAAVDSDDCHRVVRGGTWDSEPTYLRTAFRGGFTPDYIYNNRGGFRLLRTLP